MSSELFSDLDHLLILMHLKMTHERPPCTNSCLNQIGIILIISLNICIILDVIKWDKYRSIGGQIRDVSVNGSVSCCVTVVQIY